MPTDPAVLRAVWLGRWQAFAEIIERGEVAIADGKTDLRRLVADLRGQLAAEQRAVPESERVAA